MPSSCFRRPLKVPVATVMLAVLLPMPAGGRSGVGFAAPAAEPTAARSRIRFQNGTVQTAKRTGPELAAAVERVSRAGHGHFVLQFDAPVTDEVRAKLAQAGVSLRSYLGDNAFFAMRNAGFDGASLARIGAVRDVLTVRSEWKLHPAFVTGNIPPWAIQTIAAVGPGAIDETTPDANETSRAVEPAAEGSRETYVAAYVMFHEGVPLDPVGVNLALRHGAVVTSKAVTANMLVVEMPLDNVHLLVNEDEVMWIEPPLPRFAEVNDGNRARTGANIVHAAPYNLDGAGVTVLVYDGGFGRTTHLDFQGRAFNGVGEPACETVSQHSTHVAGTIGGAGIANPTYKGMAPGVSIVHYAFNTGNPPNCTLTQGFLYTDPGDIESNYGTAINTYDAHIANNSIGTNTANNGYPCDWEGNYGATDVVIDNIVRGSLSAGTPFRIVWANGNERGGGGGRCGTTYRTTAPPACAKNHLTVGALNSNDDSMTSFSSWGPADDGRMKPDISAPGCQVGGDSGVTSCNNTSDTAYVALCGTSMASPTVCGLSALLLQDFRAQFPSRPDFRNSTLRILWAHTAVDLGNPGPDNQFGYGSVRVQPAVDFLRTGNHLEAEVSQGGSYNVLVVVNPGDPEFKATLAWDDPPGTPNVNPVLVNDLDLVVFDPSNTQRFPWTLSLANPGNPAVQTQRNSVDNIEQVRVASPAAGVWRIEVRGFNVPQGPQPFSLCASPLLVNCSRQGVIALDKAQYNCSATASIKVIDCDLNADDNAVETVAVNVSSTTEPGGETVILTETGPQTADFRGTIDLSTTDGAGILHVTDGDTITAAYVDADDGMGGINVTVTSTAEVDCVAPVISNVQVSNVGPRSATITFITDEPAKGTIRYGTSCGSLSQSVTGAAFLTSHSFTLTGLADNTQHFFAIDAVDPSANSSTDDNGGSCYTFTTTEIPDSFTEEFASGDFDLDNTSLLFTPNGSIDYYAMCASSITVLPTDPAGGTPITLADNANSNITLSGGAQVSLYGVNYSNFFVGSNGYITFNTGDTDSTPSIADHFNRPRISAIFSNLNPAIGGTVSWKQLADRAVVTFQNVPLASTTNSNTFQYELFFDGRIRISYLQIDVTTGISGLSGGGGIPPDFFEMNLSGAASCGPQPPAAASRTHETPINIPLDITLIAGDDGIPGPLSYIITSLPAAPLEDLGNSHTIQPGDLPYTLAGGGNQVRYHSGPTPTTDSFQFKVNDGGTPPTGGDSNTATVTINVQPVLALPFFDDFPTTTFDSQKWYLVDTVTIDDVGIAEPSAPYSARFNGMPDGSDELQSHLINLSGQTAVRLSYWFQCRGGGESPDAGEDLVVEFRNDVGNWQEIQRHLGTLPDMTTYQQVSILLPSSAFHPAFRLRFRNTGTSSATTPFDDWFVDDVSINVANAPTADNMAVTAPFNGFLDIALSASDPNLDPLNFTILSLPASGTLKDPGAGLTEITTVPYTLAGGGNVVRYTPPPAFGGVVQFNFKANDGTYDSNTATVTVTVEPVLNLPFFDDFPTTTFDSGKWGFVSGATIDTLGIAEPSEPNSLRMNGNPSGADEVYTFAIDLSVHTAVRLSYYYQLRGGGGSPEAGDDLVVFYRDSVGNWQEIQRHLGSGADMTTYQQVVIDLPPQARHAGFRLRFRSTGGTGATDDDWFVDDVSIISLNNPVAQNASLTTAVNTVGSTLLPANDPNGDTLTWVIQSLPTNGLLKDPNGGIITTVPYSLLSNANSILYKPAFNYQGSDSFTFKATDGVYDSGTASVSVTVGGAAVIHFFPLDTDPGWSCDPGAGGGGPNNGGWAFGTPTNSDPPCGTGRLDPPGGFTGANVYGYNLAGCYTGLLSPTRWLTTTPLDCSNATAVQLRFRRWLGVESGAFDHAYIQVSTNGSTWTPVWDHTGVTIAEQAWSQQTYSLPTADNQPTVYIRWGMGTTDASVHYQGWNIDDIEILGLVPQTCDAVLPGDLNGDGLRNGDDIQGMVTVTIDPFLATAAQTCAADVNEDNAIDAADPPALVQLLLTTP